jgi:hypothetical protein
VALDCFASLAMTRAWSNIARQQHACNASLFISAKCRKTAARRANHIALAKTCPALRVKINRFAIAPNHTYDLRVPSHTRGVSRSSRTLVRDAMDAMRHETSDAVADGEIVWSWRPDAGAKSLRCAGVRFEDDGGKQARSPGRARISRNTIVQGMPVDAVDL